MLQRQGTVLNQSRTPERREQVTPGPVRAASGVEIDLLGDDVAAVEGRASTLESRMAFAEADIDALQASDTAQSASIAGHTSTLSTHSGQIAALQSSDGTQAGQISTLQVQVATLGSGALKLNVRTITASGTANATDYLILVDATAGAVVVTLPALSAGRAISVKKIDASANAVSIASAALIDGAASQPITPQYACLDVMCDGTTWWIV